MSDTLPFGGELLLRLSWGPRNEALDAVAAKLRATAAVVQELPDPFGRQFTVVDTEGVVVGDLLDLTDDELVLALGTGVARNEDGSPLVQDGYSARLETDPASTLSGRVVGRFGATRSRFSSGNWLSVTVAQTFSEKSVGTDFFIHDRGRDVLRELVAIWEPDKAGVFLAEAEDAFFDLDLPIELGVLTYLASTHLPASELFWTREADQGTWIELRGTATAGGLNQLVAIIIKASEQVNRSSPSRN